MGCFWPPAGNSVKIPGNFPPSGPHRPPPGRTPGFFGGKYSVLIRYFGGFFPGKRGVFPGRHLPKIGASCTPRNPPEISPGISAVLPCFLRFKIGKKGSKWGGFWGQFGRNFPEFPEISRNSPPGAPGCPPEKPPRNLGPSTVLSEVLPPENGPFFHPGGSPGGPGGCTSGNPGDFGGVPEAVLPCFLRMKKRENRSKIGQKSTKFDKIRQISPPADFAGPPENPRKSPRFSPGLHFSRGGLPPPKTPGICKKCKSGNFVQIFRQIFSAKKIFFSSKS